MVGPGARAARARPRSSPASRPCSPRATARCASSRAWPSSATCAPCTPRSSIARAARPRRPSRIGDGERGMSSRRAAGPADPRGAGGDAGRAPGAHARARRAAAVHGDLHRHGRDPPGHGPDGRRRARPGPGPAGHRGAAGAARRGRAASSAPPRCAPSRSRSPCSRWPTPGPSRTGRRGARERRPRGRTGGPPPDRRPRPRATIPPAASGCRRAPAGEARRLGAPRRAVRGRVVEIRVGRRISPMAGRRDPERWPRSGSAARSSEPDLGGSTWPTSCRTTQHGSRWSSACVAVAYGIGLTVYLLKQPAGDERMREIAAAIQEGAQAYLKRQYTIIAGVAVVLFVLIGVLGSTVDSSLLGWKAAIGFLIGAVGVRRRRLHRHERLGAHQRAHRRGRQGAASRAALGVAFKGGSVTGPAGGGPRPAVRVRLLPHPGSGRRRRAAARRPGLRRRA